MDDNQNQYWSFYDSYVGKFNRVMLWFNPYRNGSGTLEVYSYDKNETVSIKKKHYTSGVLYGKEQPPTKDTS